MPREMLINVAESEECRVAVVENGSLEELYVERPSLSSRVGNIYKAKIVNIEAGIQKRADRNILDQRSTKAALGAI